MDSTSLTSAQSSKSSLPETKAPPLYCVDTSSFLHAWRRDYPPDVFPTFWDNLAESANQSLVVSPQEVLLELERGGDDVYAWARAHPDMFHPPTQPVQDEVERIVRRWPEFVPEDSEDGVWADPYVIALARVRGAIVVTGEKAVGPGARVPKIPNICSALGVLCTDLLGLIRANGWHF